MKNFFLSVNLWGLFVCFLLSIPAKGYDDKYLKDIQKEVITSLPFPLVQEDLSFKIPTITEVLFNFVKKLPRIPVFTQPNIPIRDRLILASQYQTPYPLKENPIIDFELINKLEVLKSVQNSPESLIKYITSFDEGGTPTSFLSTTAGLKAISELISMPTANITTLKNRQSAIKILTENNVLRTQAYNLLKKMQEAEVYFYSFQATGRDVDHGILRRLNLDQNTLLANFKYLFSLLYSPASVLIGADRLRKTSLANFINQFDVQIFKHYKKELKGTVAPDELNSMIKQHMNTYKQTPAYKNLITKESRKLTAIPAIFSAPYLVLFANQIKNSLADLYNNYKQLIQLATYIRSAQKLLTLFAQNPEIVKVLPTLKKTMRAYTTNTARPRDLRMLLKQLNTHIFDGPKPSLTTSPGKILTVLQLVDRAEVWKHLATLIHFIGTLDVYVALAQKIKTHEHLKAQLSFVTFDQKSTYPFIKASGSWNPFISPSQVIPNDFNLNENNTQRGILLTGPNTSGKSTFIKTVLYNLLLAQTFGIACAQSMTFTPFAQLLTYINITEDLAGGISQFKAETIRAQELKNRILQLSPHEFAFIIMDEFFTGTDPEHAKMLNRILLKNLSSFKNVLFISATHFKKLAELERETNGLIKNYYLDAIVDAKGKIIEYTRKLMPGVAQYSSAYQVAKESGIVDNWKPILSEKAKPNVTDH